jgi:hypothetical protein
MKRPWKLMSGNHFILSVYWVKQSWHVARSLIHLHYNGRTYNVFFTPTTMPCVCMTLPLPGVGVVTLHTTVLMSQTTGNICYLFPSMNNELKTMCKIHILSICWFQIQHHTENFRSCVMQYLNIMTVHLAKYKILN